MKKIRFETHLYGNTKPTKDNENQELSRNLEMLGGNVHSKRALQRVKNGDITTTTMKCQETIDDAL